MLLTIAAGLAFAIWVYLALGRGFFWIVREERGPDAPSPGSRVVAVIPARNEAETIAAAVHSLLVQDYAIELIVVDDHSEDATAQLARGIAADCGASDRFHLVHAAALPPGWTGKMWAVSEGLKHASAMHPNYILLTDADIHHAPDNVRRLVGRAERDSLELASIMVKLRCESFSEKLLIPAFVFFFFKLYPPKWVTARGKQTAAAAGGCMLIRWTALQRIGGVVGIRNELIDDCALARSIKQHGRVWMGVSRSTESIRPYEGTAGIWRMISRSAFTQLNYSTVQLACAVIGMIVVYVIPLIAIAAAPAASYALWLGAATFLLMLTLYAPVLLFYGVNPLWGLLLPAVALFYSGATINSAVRYWTGRGGEWKGRVQAARM